MRCENCLHGMKSYDAEGEFYRCEIRATPYGNDCKFSKAVRPHCKLIAYTPNPVRVIETAAAVCYGGNTTSEGRLMRNCYKAGHLSVFEHVSFTFSVEGVSRVLLAQITRHRHASFSVRSQRYCNEDGFRFVEQPSMTKVGGHGEPGSFSACMSDDDLRYSTWVRDGVSQEDARYLLPGGIETKFVVTMNARELMHLCNLRLCSRAQWEIRNLVQMMRDAVVAVCPDFDPYLVPQCEVHAPYNFCTETKSCGRHPKLKDVYKEDISDGSTT